jgi:4-aminobutyrate aminotransferase-like enzyme
MKSALLEYVQNDGITHSLDAHTTAKAAFIEAFHSTVLEPPGLDHKIMFPGPTGTNAVEAALKLARKATGRDTVVSFTNAFHGMTLGSLAITGNSMKRQGAGVALGNADVDALRRVPRRSGRHRRLLRGVPRRQRERSRAAGMVILETVQAEGGINVAGFDWLRRLAGCASATASCSPSTTSRSGAAAPDSSSASTTSASPPTSSASRSRSAATACPSPSPSCAPTSTCGAPASTTAPSAATTPRS